MRVLADQRRAGAVRHALAGHVVDEGIEIAVVEFFGRFVGDRLEGRLGAVFFEFGLDAFDHGDRFVLAAEFVGGLGRRGDGDEGCKNEERECSHGFLHG